MTDTRWLIEFTRETAIEFLRDLQHKMQYDAEDRRLKVNVTGLPLQNVCIAAFAALMPAKRSMQASRTLTNIHAGYYEHGEPVKFNSRHHEYQWKFDQLGLWVSGLRKLPTAGLDASDRSRDFFYIEDAEVLMRQMQKAGLKIEGAVIEEVVAERSDEPKLSYVRRFAIDIANLASVKRVGGNFELRAKSLADAEALTETLKQASPTHLASSIFSVGSKVYCKNPIKEVASALNLAKEYTLANSRGAL